MQEQNNKSENDLGDTVEQRLVTQIFSSAIKGSFYIRPKLRYFSKYQISFFKALER